MTDIVPQWIERVGVNRGRDHLGIQAVGQTMLEHLTSGYSNITQRLRYFSFYTWVLKAFFDSNLTKDKKQFNLFLKEKIFLYTVSNGFVHANESRSGIDGIDFVRNNLHSDLEKNLSLNLENFLKDFKNNYWMYKAKMSDLGLTHQDMDKSEIPSLNENSAKKLAELFEKSFTLINPLETNLKTITKKDLEKLESQWGYDQLNKNLEERQLLEDILFAKVENKNDKAISRRYSLILFLMHIKENKNLTMHEFELWLENKRKLSENLNKTRNLWRLLFIRNRQVFAIESIFYYFLSLCRDHKIDQTNLEFAIKNSLENDLENNAQSSLIFDFWEKPLSFLLNELEKKAQENEELSEFLIAKNLRGISKAKRLTMATDHFSSGFLNLLAIYNRLNNYPPNAEENDFENMGQIQRYSLQRHIDLINQYLTQKLLVKDVAYGFLKEEILSRHQLLASEKFFDRRQDTFHFTLENNFYVINPIAKNFSPQYNAMKFQQATNFFEDLNLIEFIHDSKNIELSSRGQDIIEKFYE